MNQTRAFLIFAWLMVAMLLWMEWQGEREAPAATPDTAATTGTPASPADGTVPDAATLPSAPVPAAPAGTVPSATPAAPSVGASPSTDAITVTTDVLRVVLDGGTVRSAELRRYPRTTDDGSPPVQLFTPEADGYFVAQSGWVRADGPAPNHLEGFVPEGTQRAYALPRGGMQVEVPFVWTGPDGVTIRRTYTLSRNDYAITVRDEIANGGTAAWNGHVYRQLLRDPPPKERGFTNPESFSFTGAAWYSPEEKYEKRDYGDFADDGPLDRTVQGGWLGLLQHYFFAAWIPDPSSTATYSLATVQGQGDPRYLVRAVGPSVAVAPGQTAQTTARLWVGPKLQDRLDDVAPGLGLTLDYGVFTFLAKPIAWLLAQLHEITKNWGWAIVLLVVIIKLLLYPLSAAQYKSAARMRKFQPRVEQLKERYGDDRQKFQMALMELYKKEKINPVGGCLPILLQIPVFLALYWVLLESVELRQAVWIPGWVDDLTAPDPFFILPVVNIAVMWFTQKLTPTPGMDPMQKKMMQMMPLVFGVLMVFFPAGLVLYWVTNGALGLLQQWWNIRRFGDAPAARKA
ncbi:membrane protein insertase YidC [Luteimonas pelagia]